jgi:hypothetical protein
VRSAESSEDAELEDEDRALISDFDRESLGVAILRAEAFLAGVVLVLVGVGLEGVGLDGVFGVAVFDGAGFVSTDFEGFSDFSDFSAFDNLSDRDDFSDFDDLSSFDGDGVGEEPGNAPMRFATALFGGAAFGGSAFAAVFEEEDL